MSFMGREERKAQGRVWRSVGGGARVACSLWDRTQREGEAGREECWVPNLNC